MKNDTNQSLAEYVTKHRKNYEELLSEQGVSREFIDEVLAKAVRM